MGELTVLEVTSMTCGSCEAAVRAALGAVPGVEAVAVDLEARRVQVRHGAGVDAAALHEAVESAGFEVAGVVEGDA